jgi:hypothetical protein
MNNARILLCFILAGYVFSAYPGSTYYVDYSAGSDANNGISTSTAWQHCPGDANATGNAAITLAPGSTVIFKGGITYIGQIVVGASGASGNPITYDGNSAGTWGTGKAILSGNGVNNGVGFSITSQNYVMIQNFEICHYGDYTSAQLATYNCTSNPLPEKDGTGIALQQVSNITIQNCYFHENGVWQNTSPVNGDNDVTGTGIMVYSGSNVTITGNELTKMSQPINLSTDGTMNNLTQVTVSNNNIHDYVRWLICIGSGTNHSTIQDINIYGNSLHDYPEYDGSQVASFCLNGTDDPHDDGIIFLVGTSSGSQCYTNNTLGTPAHPIKVYDNLFYNDNTTSGGGTAFIFLTQWGGTVYVYNNIFINSHPQDLGGEGNIYAQDGLLASDNNPAADYHFWNNTFFDNQPAIFIRSLTPGYDFNRPGYTIDIRNNLMNLLYTTDTLVYNFSLVVMEADNATNDITPSLPTTMDYNWYFVTASSPYQSSSSTQIINACPSNYNYNASYSVAGIYSKYGFEQHGHYGDPLFVNITYGLGNNSSLNNLNLQPSSPAINAGVSLDSFFTTDILGNPRPPSERKSQVSGWDIGAYEYQSSGVIEMPPPAASEFTLSAYPNPFRGPVTVAFNVPIIHRGSLNNFVEVAIYDLKGVLIAQLAKGAYRAGRYLIPWDASAIGLSACFVRMKAKNFEKQLMLIRVGK